MAAFAESQGFGAVSRNGGTIDLLKSLVAGGFPVLVETVHYSGPDVWWDWVSHNRVVMGYDEGLQVFYTYDSILGSGADGEGRAADYAEFEASWWPFGRAYLVIYRLEDEPMVQEILGEQWDVAQNTLFALEQAQYDHETNTNALSLFNLGAAQFNAAQIEDAAATFDEALALRQPDHLLWYRFEPFETYLALGRYQDVINLTYRVTGNTKGVEEMYYYLGRAYEGLGNRESAIANYTIAVERNTSYQAAIEALARLEDE
jgi:tetratricopeptide (TPR) repeat protein